VSESTVAQLMREQVAVDYVIGYLRPTARRHRTSSSWPPESSPPGETTAIRRGHPFRVITTRRHHPGPRSLQLQVNGHLSGPAAFTFDAP
jgi:hypothetical protein